MHLEVAVPRPPHDAVHQAQKTETLQAAQVEDLLDFPVGDAVPDLVDDLDSRIQEGEAAEVVDRSIDPYLRVVRFDGRFLCSAVRDGYAESQQVDYEAADTDISGH